MQTTPSPPRITAVIVLYQRAARDSEACTSLLAILASHPGWAARFQLLLYDNSPNPADNNPPSSASFLIAYIRDPGNGGLAAAYNYALEQARANHHDWLLLLDQDTTLTPAWLAELLATLDHHSQTANLGAIVPLLELDGCLYSPEKTFLYHLRHQFPHTRFYRAMTDTHGLQPAELNAYNSGAALRVSALEQIGGFPSSFRIDYLDHAVFHLLYQHGFVIYVLAARLQQKLSHIDLNDVPLARHTSVLQSQTLFVARYGTLLDRLLFRFWILRRSRPYRALCKDPRVWKAMVRQALLPWKLIRNQPPAQPPD